MPDTKPIKQVRILPYPWPYKHMLTETPRAEGGANYGILAINQETGAVAKVADVTTDKAKAENLLQRCVDGGVSPLHLKDIVEDWLAE